MGGVSYVPPDDGSDPSSPVARTATATEATAAAVALQAYATNDFEDAEPFYAGKEKLDGTWLVIKLTEATGAIRYANASNNPTVADYTAAWAARASLVYGIYEAITGV
jgi:hypothetical protein